MKVVKEVGMQNGKVRRVVATTEPIFRIRGREWEATGKMLEDGFIVFAGSTVNHICDCFTKDKQYFPLRMKCEREGVIRNNTFVTDYIFRTPCQAGSVIACHYVNVNKEWKTADKDEFTWGECHPKREGESKTYASRVPAKKVEEKVVLGLSVRDGVRVFTKREGNWIVEWRGCVNYASM